MNWESPWLCSVRVFVLHNMAAWTSFVAFIPLCRPLISPALICVQYVQNVQWYSMFCITVAVAWLAFLSHAGDWCCGETVALWAHRHGLCHMVIIYASNVRHKTQNNRKLKWYKILINIHKLMMDMTQCAIALIKSFFLKIKREISPELGLRNSQQSPAWGSEAQSGS